MHLNKKRIQSKIIMFLRVAPVLPKFLLKGKYYKSTLQKDSMGVMRKFVDRGKRLIKSLSIKVLGFKLSGN